MVIEQPSRTRYHTTCVCTDAVIKDGDDVAGQIDTVPVERADTNCKHKDTDIGSASVTDDAAVQVQCVTNEQHIQDTLKWDKLSEQRETLAQRRNLPTISVRTHPYPIDQRPNQTKILKPEDPKQIPFKLPPLQHNHAKSTSAFATRIREVFRARQPAAPAPQGPTLVLDIMSQGPEVPRDVQAYRWVLVVSGGGNERDILTNLVNTIQGRPIPTHTMIDLTEATHEWMQVVLDNKRNLVAP